ncbi:peptidylprolyl isomerase [Anthocerotibacter panamensis]|uniref:peptidylprolyl isomerase n=1 Tax=Anthocerotibacter panamensis TaxID=2857077 RepID=UPI001C403C1D|nr:peptidylprolyl isomerase [Anthocerotibacter panamensis]
MRRHFWCALLIVPLMVGCGSAAGPSTSAPVQPAGALDPTQGLPKYPKKALVNLETTKGLIVVEVDGENAPVSAGNFLDLVKRSFYNGLTFHRVVPDFVVQGGDPQGNGTGGFIDPLTKRERTIPLEIKVESAKEPSYGKTLDPNLGSAPPILRHNKGVLAWARSQDPNSASSQFYITLADTPFLDGKYAVFGKVVKGLEVVEKITQGDKIVKATLADKS